MTELKSSCTVEGCAKPLFSLGMCAMHYFRMRAIGKLFRTCAACEKAVPLHGKKYCSRKCRDREYRKRPSVAAMRLEKKRLSRKRPEVKKQRSAYSAEYSQRPAVRERKRVSGRIRKHHHRAFIRGATAEKFDPLEIFDRDGWRCGLCGTSTPKSKRGTYDAKAPELDHIIPISAGGPHTRMNVQCACRACNMAKGSKPLGQLRLVG